MMLKFVLTVYIFAAIAGPWIVSAKTYTIMHILEERSCPKSLRPPKGTPILETAVDGVVKIGQQYAIRSAEIGSKHSRGKSLFLAITFIKKL